MVQPAAHDALSSPAQQRSVRGRFRLRWLFAAVGLCALAFALVSFAVRKPHFQTVRIERIQANPAIQLCSTWWKQPGWLLEVPWGDRIHAFDRLHGLQLGGAPGAQPELDTIWEDVAGLEDMQVMSLESFEIGLEEMRVIESLPLVKHLRLIDCTFASGAIERLGQRHQLETLWLHRSQIDDDSLAELSGLTKLRELGLSYTQVTDEGMTHLQGLTQLEHLELSATGVTEEGWRPLQAERPALNVLDD